MNLSRIAAFVLPIGLFCGSAQAEEILVVNPRSDVALAVGSNLVWAGLYFGLERDLKPAPFSTTAPTGLDAVSVGRWSPGAARTSDVLLYGMIPASLAASMVGAGRLSRPADGALLFLQSWGLTGAMVDGAKVAISRPRPFNFHPNPNADILEHQAEGDATLSFPSGHTAFMGAMSFTAAGLLSHGQGVEPGLAYGGAAALTAGVGALRVLAGRHYPTDVLAGAGIGAAVGVLVVESHIEARAKTVGASGASGARMVQVGGTF
jgi:membrane-associated phospholipid phosphatase